MLIFDGKGGMVRRQPGADHPAVPPGGFKLVVDNSKGPEFKLWLKSELGEHNSALVTASECLSRKGIPALFGHQMLARSECRRA